MSKQLKTVQLAIRYAHGNHKIKAYLSEVAGLCVHPEYAYDDNANRYIRKQNNWVISQYPTGMKAFSGCPTKEDALAICTNLLQGFNWVGFDSKAIMAPNDMDKIRSLVVKVGEEIATRREAFNK